MADPHPWRRLAGLRHVVVIWVPMAGKLGASDGRTIWLHPAQPQVQRRCTLAHELEHVARGHRGCQPSAAEDEVRRAAARWLLPRFDLVLDALAWAGGDLEEAAGELWVDEPTLAARLEDLTPPERDEMVRRSAP